MPRRTSSGIRRGDDRRALAGRRGAGAARRAKAAGIPAILDADMAAREVLERLVPLATHVVASESAAKLVTGADTARGGGRAAGSEPWRLRRGDRGRRWLLVDRGRRHPPHAGAEDRGDRHAGGGRCVPRRVRRRPRSKAGRCATIIALRLGRRGDQVHAVRRPARRADARRSRGVPRVARRRWRPCVTRLGVGPADDAAGVARGKRRPPECPWSRRCRRRWWCRRRW